MKKTLLTCVALASMALSAETVERAQELFNNRLADKNNALSAADIYASLATAASDATVQANLRTKESQALYYYGGQITDKDTRKKVYTRGKDVAEKAFKALSASRGVPAPGVSNQDLALAHYFYAINLGKWGQVNGISDSLGELPNLVANLEIVDSLDESVEEYGATRTRGRVKHKVPAVLARLRGLNGFGKEEAMDELASAYENTLVDVDGVDYQVSTNSTTTLYYLDVLADLKRKSEFCNVLGGAVALAKADDAKLAEVNPSKVAEQRNDYNELLKCLNNEDKCDDADFAAGKDVNKLAKSCRL